MSVRRTHEPAPTERHINFRVTPANCSELRDPYFCTFAMRREPHANGTWKVPLLFGIVDLFAGADG